jgi:hypothetical protein
LSWLKQTGEKLGYSISRSNSQDGRPVPIREITSLVQVIIARGQSIPENLRQLLREVISQRKEAAIFYRSRGQREADVRHAYYVQVLEGALKSFEKSINLSPVVPSGDQDGSSRNQADFQLSNLFDLLEVDGDMSNGASNSEHDSDSESEIEVKNQSSEKPRKIKFGKRKGKGKKPKKTVKVLKKVAPSTDIDAIDSLVQAHQVDDELDDDDLYFMIYCFFKDWNSLREYLQERWCDLTDGIISLAAVSLITNTAFELLRRSEQELLSQIPRDSGLTDYQSMANMLFLDIGLAHVNYDEKTLECDDEEKMSEAIYEVRSSTLSYLLIPVPETTFHFHALRGKCVFCISAAVEKYWTRKMLMHDLCRRQTG